MTHNRSAEGLLQRTLHNMLDFSYGQPLQARFDWIWSQSRKNGFNKTCAAGPRISAKFFQLQVMGYSLVTEAAWNG